MARIFISPSTQDWNSYKGGSNEEVQMREVATIVVQLLVLAGHTVKMGGKVSANANVAMGNAWSPHFNYYIALHSNAGGGNGTEVWHSGKSTSAHKMADAIYKHLAPLTSAPDRGVKIKSGYIETGGPRGDAGVIIEIAFHDNIAESKEIKAHHTEFADGIVDGILEVVGGSLTKPKPAPKPKCHNSSTAPVLKAGSNGAWVKHLQRDLNRHGAKLTVDGDFGNKTTAAVKAFQIKNHLVRDGVVGKATWTKLS